MEDLEGGALVRGLTLGLAESKCQGEEIGLRDFIIV